MFTVEQPQRDSTRTSAVLLTVCTTEQTRAGQSDIIALMATNLSMSAEAKEESDQRWTRWIAAGARRNRERQKRITRVAIVIAIVFAIWLAKLLVRG